MSATERAAARIRADAAAIVKQEEEEAAKKQDATMREQRRLRASEESEATRLAEAARAEEEKAETQARRDLLLGSSGVLSKLQQGQQELRAARLQGLATMAASPRGGCRASAAAFDDGMRLIGSAGMPGVDLLGADGGAQRRSLSAMRMSALTTLARSEPCCVGLDDLDDAMDSPAPKEAVIELILRANNPAAAAGKQAAAAGDLKG
jgi:hypothetical protein